MLLDTLYPQTDILIRDRDFFILLGPERLPPSEWYDLLYGRYTSPTDGAR
jgi:hypothetical protein